MTEYEIFRRCFTQLAIDEHTFSLLACPEGAQVFHEDGAFAITCGNRITLLCTAPEKRGNGAGSRLLAQCEQHIRSNGEKEVRLGGSLLPGAAYGSYDFFAKRGYTIGGEFNEMSLKLSGFSAPEDDIPDGARFCMCTSDISELHRAVAAVDEEWVQYFTYPDAVFCCYYNGVLASFCIIGDDEHCILSDGKAKVGSIGCVGTVPEFRRRGLGLRMVALAAQHLKDRGCDDTFIHWTHLDKWYGRLGAQVVLKFSPADKVLP